MLTAPGHGELPATAKRFRPTISGVSGFGWADGWCEGTKHGCTVLDETRGSNLTTWVFNNSGLGTRVSGQLRSCNRGQRWMA